MPSRSAYGCFSTAATSHTSTTSVLMTQLLSHKRKRPGQIWPGLRKIIFGKVPAGSGCVDVGTDVQNSGAIRPRRREGGEWGLKGEAGNGTVHGGTLVTM